MYSLNKSTDPDFHYEHGDQDLGASVFTAEKKNSCMKMYTGDMHMFTENKPFFPLLRLCYTLHLRQKQ